MGSTDEVEFMVTIFRRSTKGPYYIQWFDHTGKRRSKSSGTTDHPAAKRIASHFETEAAVRREGAVNPRTDELIEFASKPIAKHLDSYVAACHAKGSRETHIESTRSMIDHICKDGKAKILADLTADVVNRYAAAQRESNVAARTIAKHLQAIKGFTRWLTNTGKLASNPLLSVQKPSAEDDRRKVRRFLSHAEFHWLDSTTRTRGERFGMSGVERALLYTLAIQTGLRSNECRSLTRG
jgi:Phage integrase, N-terminal SAM-like domain